MSSDRFRLSTMQIALKRQHQLSVPSDLLTYPAFDPVSHEPSYTHAAVRVRRAGPGLNFQIIAGISSLTGLKRQASFYNPSQSGTGMHAFDLSQVAACAFCRIRILFLRLTALSV